MADLAVQTTVTTAPAIGAPGMAYDSSLVQDVISKVALVDIPFGAFVKVTADGCTLPGASGDVTGAGRGIALLDPGRGTGVGYKAGDIVAVMQLGRVWVLTEEAVTAYTSPYVRFTANTSPTRAVGSFLAGADSGKAVQPTGMRYWSTNGAAGLAVIEILPGEGGATGPAGPTGPTGPTGP